MNGKSRKIYMHLLLLRGVNPYLKIIRPFNCVMGALAVVLVAIIVNGLNLIDYSQEVILGMAVVFLSMAGGNVLNDYYDRDVDLINHPNRPIPSGEISPKNAVVYGTVLFSIALFLALLINPCALAIAAYAQIIMLLYESSLKKEGFVGNVAISILVGMIFIFGGAIIGNIQKVIIFAFMAGLANLGREIVKDVEDICGDLDRKTLPKKIGKKRAGIVASIFFISAVALSPLPYLLLGFSIWYLLTVMISDAIFIYTSIIHFKNPSLGQKYAKLAMLAGLGAYLVGGLT